MKLKVFILFLMVSLMATTSFGEFFWRYRTSSPAPGGDREWATMDPVAPWGALNWAVTEDGLTETPTPPDGTTECRIVGGADVTLNTNEVWAATGSAATTGCRLRVTQSATLNIQTGSLTGPGWIRIGERSSANTGVGGVSVINQTGGRLELRGGSKDPARLMCSDGGLTPATNSDGIYQISGGVLTSSGAATLPKVNYDEGRIVIGDRDGKGTFRVIGTDPTITMGMLYVGANFMTTYRKAQGTLMFDLNANGVSPITLVTKDYTDPTLGVVTVQPIVDIDGAGGASLAALVVNLTQALNPLITNIVLVNNTGTNAVVGRFDTFNGDWASEGAWVDLGGGFGVMGKLSYVGGTGNDITLQVPEPATLALLSLGLFIIRRNKK